jgi:hypothetical protein
MAKNPGNIRHKNTRSSSNLFIKNKTNKRRYNKIKGGVNRGTEYLGTIYEPVVLLNKDNTFKLPAVSELQNQNGIPNYSDPISDAINNKIQGTRLLESSKAVVSKTLRGLAGILVTGSDAVVHGEAFHSRNKIARQNILNALNAIITPEVKLYAPHIWKYVDANNEYNGPDTDKQNGVLNRNRKAILSNYERKLFLLNNPLPANLTFDGVPQQKPLSNLPASQQVDGLDQQLSDPVAAEQIDVVPLDDAEGNLFESGKQVNGAGRKTKRRRNKTKRGRK